MITDKDIEKLKQTFLTKEESNKNMELIDNKFDAMEDRINAKFTDFKLSIIQAINKNTELILQELQSQRQDWKNHERRITRLEEKVGFKV